MGSKKGVQQISSLIEKHRDAITAIKSQIVPHCSEAKLEDGTQLDELFYLRYVMSIKSEDLDSSVKANYAKTVETILEQLNWRKGMISGHGNTHEQKEWCHPAFSDRKQNIEKKLTKKIPMHRTGELVMETNSQFDFQGFPIVVLPVSQVDFEYLFQKAGNVSNLENEILDFMLVQKEKVFRELDKKSRAQGVLVKSVVVYDLSGMSFASVYKLTKFFKLVQKHSKKFKAYFPQSTHSTVILNSPGTWVLKMFSSSKKQRIMNVDEFLEFYNAKNAVPKFLGGNAVWPGDISSKLGAEHVKSLEGLEIKGDDIESLPSTDSILKNVDESLQNLEKSSVRNTVNNKLVLNEIVDERTEKGVRINPKISLTCLEKEMVYMKKNKVFSIDVLEANQEINLFFINRRNKNANILIAVKEKCSGALFADDNPFVSKNMYAIVNSTTVLKEGPNHLKLNVKRPSEILLIYVNRQDSHEGHSNIETARFRQSKMKRVKDLVPRLTLKRRNQYRYAKYNENKDSKVFFWFEVSDAVQAGEFMGNETIKQARVVLNEYNSKNNYLPSAGLLPDNANINASSITGVKVTKIKRNEKGLIDYDEDANSVRSDAGRSKSNRINVGASDSFLGFLWS